MFCLSMKPSSRRASRIPSARPESVAASAFDRYPNRETFFGCCASVTTATASSIAATKIDDQPTFFIAHLVTEAITQAVFAETIIYGRRETGFVEGERPNFDAGFELYDASGKSYRICS